MATDRVIGGLLLLLAAAYAWLSGGIPRTLVDDPLGPRFYPRVLAGLLGICSVALIVRPPTALGAGPSSAAPPRAAGGTRRLLATIGLTAVYLVAMPIAGYLVSTPLYLAALARLLGCGRPRALVVTAVALTMVLGLVFDTMLGVRLPAGSWFE
jgi:putative tricarboxylic transport membrane protein